MTFTFAHFTKLKPTIKAEQITTHIKAEQIKQFHQMIYENALNALMKIRGGICKVILFLGAV